MRLSSGSFKQLVFYGEVVGFLLAWAVGLAVAMQPADEQAAGPAPERVENYASLGDILPAPSGLK